MMGVKFDPAGEYCIGDAGRRAILENLYLYQGALNKCNATIEEYNKSVNP